MLVMAAPGPQSMGCYNTYSIVIGIPDDIKAKLITSLGDTQTLRAPSISLAYTLSATSLFLLLIAFFNLMTGNLLCLSPSTFQREVFEYLTLF